MYSTLPWPKGCSRSAGFPAHRKLKRVTREEKESERLLRVGNNRQAVDDKAGGQFHRPQDQVDTNAYGTCPLSLFDADILGFYIPVVLFFHGRVHYLQRYSFPSLDRLV